MLQSREELVFKMPVNSPTCKLGVGEFVVGDFACGGIKRLPFLRV